MIRRPRALTRLCPSPLPITRTHVTQDKNSDCEAEKHSPGLGIRVQSLGRSKGSDGDLELSAEMAASQKIRSFHTPANASAKNQNDAHTCAVVR